MKDKLIIGLSGLAESGKDTFYNLYSKLMRLEYPDLKVRNLALADLLKKEVKDWCIKHYGIDPLSCAKEGKDIIRSLLVAHGKIKRNLTKGAYFYQELEKQINQDKETDIFVVTDVRYKEFEFDETDWLLKERPRFRSLLIHLEKKILIRKELRLGRFCLTYDRVSENAPINFEEKKNDPILRGLARFTYSWNYCQNFNYERIKDEILNCVVLFVEETRFLYEQDDCPV